MQELQGNEIIQTCFGLPTPKTLSTGFLGQSEHPKHRAKTEIRAYFNPIQQLLNKTLLSLYHSIAMQFIHYYYVLI